MKKWTAFLLALALCGSLAACGGGNNAQADSTEGKTETVETVKPEDTAEKDEQAEKDAAPTDWRLTRWGFSGKISPHHQYTNGGYAL